ncbi:hypothetical protein MLD38_009688 [Melastoma candidum]|uniref:Uncharacterized protein n=1 Tax=Melastoma candidum TaxID=119954 RepID=A0ACB9S2N9_9MYRT|nr:hypothetical protein MLD38_009688 [Melastoma candidum]
MANLEDLWELFPVQSLTLGLGCITNLIITQTPAPSVPLYFPKWAFGDFNTHLLPPKIRRQFLLAQRAGELV